MNMPSKVTYACLVLCLCAPLTSHAGEVTVPHATKMAQQAMQSLQKSHYPKRGLTMKHVKARYGAPQKIRVSKGPVKKQWPRITEWHYGAFSVYFEKHLVLHTVMH